MLLLTSAWIPTEPARAPAASATMRVIKRRACSVLAPSGSKKTAFNITAVLSINKAATGRPTWCETALISSLEHVATKEGNEYDRVKARSSAGSRERNRPSSPRSAGLLHMLAVTYLITSGRKGDKKA